MRGNLQAIQPGRTAGLFFEDLAEIALVGEAHLLRDPADGQIAGADQLLRGLDADAVQILIEGLVIWANGSSGLRKGDRTHDERRNGITDKARNTRLPPARKAAFGGIVRFGKLSRQTWPESTEWQRRNSNKVSVIDKKIGI